MPDVTVTVGMTFSPEDRSQESLSGSLSLTPAATLSGHYVTLSVGMNFTLQSRSDSGFLASGRYRE